MKKMIFKHLRIPCPLIYNTIQGRISKNEFLVSLYLYNLVDMAKHLDKLDYIATKTSDVIRNVNIKDGKPYKETKKFLEETSPYSSIYDKKIIRVLKQAIRNYCEEIQFDENTYIKTRIDHTKFFGQAYISVTGDFFDWIDHYKLNKLNLRVFLYLLKIDLQPMKQSFDIKKAVEFISTEKRYIHRSINFLLGIQVLLREEDNFKVNCIFYEKTNVSDELENLPLNG